MSGQEEDLCNPDVPVSWSKYTRLREMLQKQLQDVDNGVHDELGEVQARLNTLREVTQLRLKSTTTSKTCALCLQISMCAIRMDEEQ